jgi:hypothetical protein
MNPDSLVLLIKYEYCRLEYTRFTSQKIIAFHGEIVRKPNNGGAYA